ncbi:MAG: S49 family peptidase, partial [Polyangiales bacterium]
MLDWGHLEAGGGAMAGDGLAGAAGWYLSAGVQGQARRASHHARVMLALRQDKALNARNVLPLLRQLEQARYRPSVGAVLLQLGGNMPMAYAQEIRQRTWALKRQGKAVYCDLAAASGNELYACSAATTRFLDPAGMVRLLGPAIDVLLFGKLLARLGVRAQFVRIGKYKSAPEQWTRPRMTRPAQAQRQALLDDLYGRLQQDLARDLRWSKAKVRRIIDKGPYAAGEAREQGLVDVLSDPHDVSAHIRARHGQVWPMRDKLPPPPHRHWGKGARVGVVVIDGTIIDGENLDVPLIDVHLTGGRTVVETLERFRRDPHIRAVVLRVDSPGGSALASDQIWRAVRRLAKQKSVIASMGAVAASGGYMAAAGADEIWADPATLTGSIGVFFGKVDLSML